MKFKTFLLAGMIAATSIVFAQKNAVIKFDSLAHNFGTIHEEKGKVITKFMFKNTGNDTLKINAAESSCSCTSTDWTKTPVPPGGTGFVSADYDPIYKHGEFEKTVAVNSNATSPTVTLTIKGLVIPRTKTFKDSFPSNDGNLYYGYRQWNLKTIPIDEVKKDSMEVYNASAKPMKIAFSNLPSNITMKVKPEVIAPNSRGKLYINFDAAKKNIYGLVSDNFMLNTDDELSPSKKLFVAATITDNFSKLTSAQQADAPKISFITKEINDYGQVKEGEMVKTKFDFTNTGKMPLIIRNVSTGQTDTKASMPANSTIESGGNGSVAFEFNTEGKTGNDVRRTILITTNDPNHAFIILIIKMTITPK
jgi:hypothetical protein